MVMLCLTATMLSGCGRQNPSQVPIGYPAAYKDIIAKARTERQLLIWSAIDREKARPLIAAFKARYPFLSVDYIEMPANAVYQRFITAATIGNKTADLLWSSAMDLQIKLANDGYAQSYSSTEREHIPAWANWKDQAWGTTAEPIVMIYNRRLLKSTDVPQDHLALIHLLENSRVFDGAIATYDLPRSAVGYLYLSQDQQATHESWRLVDAMGSNHVKLFANAEEIVKDVASGHSLIGYNIVGSFALSQVEHNPNLGMVFPRDYTLLMSRLAIIPVTAKHSAAARLFLDYLLSKAGQAYLSVARMPPVRSDVKTPMPLSPKDVRLRAIRVGPALLIDQDQLSRRYTLTRWALSIDRSASLAK